MQHTIYTKNADAFEDNLLGLYFLDVTDEIVRDDVVDQEICKEVDISVRLACLQARK